MRMHEESQRNIRRAGEPVKILRFPKAVYRFATGSHFWPLSFLRRGPRMRLTRFHECEYRHQERKSSKRAVAIDRLDGERLWIRKTAAINLQAERVGAYDRSEKSQHDQGGEGSPNAQPPADQEQKPESDFCKR